MFSSSSIRAMRSVLRGARPLSSTTQALLTKRGGKKDDADGPTKPLRRLRNSSTPPSEDGVETPATTAKNAALEDVMQRINKKHGSGTISRLGDSTIDTNIERLTSGCLTLDLVLGGGIPRGRIIEIYGPESSGKSTLALCIMAEAQKLGDNVALIDAEFAYDKTYGKKLGIKDKSLFYAQPDHGDAALEIVDELCRSGTFGIITVDSVAALVPRAELEKDIGDPVVGTSARMMSSGLKRIAASASRHNCTVIFINQLRMKIGVMYGNPEVTTGGVALKYYASQRVDVRKAKAIDGEKDGPARGLRIRAKVTKNKVGAPFGMTQFDILFDRGLDKVGCLVDAAVQSEIVERRGSHHYFAASSGEVKLGNGRDAAIEFLEGEEKLVAEIDTAVREKWAAADQGVPELIGAGVDDTEEDLA